MNKFHRKKPYKYVIIALASVQLVTMYMLVIKSISTDDRLHDVKYYRKTPTTNDTPGLKTYQRKGRYKETVQYLVSDDNKTVHTWPWAGLHTMALCYKKRWLSGISGLKTSVIITFIDRESITTLLRTLHSVIQNTPRHLLHEIVLIGDNVKREVYHWILKVYLDTVFGDIIIKLHVSNSALGLIKARLLGIQKATGQVVVCIDSHVEVQKYWLEPMLYEIAKNRKVLAASSLDWIEQIDGKWHYKHGGLNWKTYFSMYLVFGFQQMSPLQEAQREDRTSSFQTPVMVGTAWAMEKNYFFEVGAFDEDMLFWGGENIDLSVRVWLMGGKVLSIPCSRVAHLEKLHYRDYRSGPERDKQIKHNYKRFLLLWVDEYLQYFYDYMPDLKMIDEGDLSKRQYLKSKQVYNMTWYLSNVFPELGIPQLEGLAYGKLENMKYKKCLTEFQHLRFCNQDPSRMLFFWSKSTLELRTSMEVYNVKTNESNQQVFIIDEFTSKYRTNSTTKWVHIKNGAFKVMNEDMCLDVDKNNFIVINVCDHRVETQMWTFQHYSIQYAALLDGKGANLHLYKELSNLRQMKTVDIV